MIVVKLIGGLGNQMFQYAAGKALALHHQTKLFIDKTDLEKDAGGAYTQRKFELSCFNITAELATEKELSLFSANDSNKIQRVFNRFFPSVKKQVVFTESGHLFHPSFFKTPVNTYLNGFWQTEKYFLNCQEEIRKEFTLKSLLPAQIQELLNKINSGNSVSLHIRRGDYVTLKSANQFHGLIGMEYYKQATEFIASQKGNINVFVFSDDLTWCQENIKLNCPVHFVQHQAGAEFDMFLMSRCSHNIIANSSFSWWGAWLNNNPNKIVVIPAHWFAGKKSSDMDIVANGWKVI